MKITSTLSRRLSVPILGLCVWSAGLAGAADTRSTPTIERLLSVGMAQGWDTLAVGERVARFGLALEGAPYVEGTLEGPGPEVCRVTTDGFDCVTFMEAALNLARTAHTEGGREATSDDITRAVTYTRYRGGRLDGYLSRLHYTSEWIADNVAKGVLEDVTPSLGGVPFRLNVGYMSAHPEHYSALRDNPGLVDSIRLIERRINSTRRTHVPRARVSAIEQRLRTGDLVAITTSIAGLDYAHTGLIVREGSGARLLHASSKNGRVLLDDRIGSYLARSTPRNTGISVLRPRATRSP